VVCQAQHGNARSSVCPYHQWTQLNGDFSRSAVQGWCQGTAIAVNGGMPEDFDLKAHGPLRVAVLHGLVFADLCDADRAWRITRAAT
jgi:salicylate 5-hydroxylase large subunit